MTDSAPTRPPAGWSPGSSPRVPRSPPDRDTDLQLPVDLAHADGLGVTAHAHSLVGAEMALDVGVDGIEHCPCLTPEGLRLTPSAVARLAASGTAVCLTMGLDVAMLALMTPPPQLLGRDAAVRPGPGVLPPQPIEAAGTLAAAGVRLLAGVDSGITPMKPHGHVGQSVADHLEAGMPVTAALACATSVSADALGLGALTGRLRSGLAADLVVVDGDLTTDAGALPRVRRVVVRGAGRYPRSMTDAALVAEAMSKSGILWVEVPDVEVPDVEVPDVEVPDGRAWPAWFAWVDDTAYVVNGLGEQYLPWLPEYVVLVLRSKDTGGRLLRVRARAQVLAPDTSAWTVAVSALQAARLNAVDDVEQRWRTDCAVTSLIPSVGGLIGLMEGPGHYDEGSGAAAPAPTRATTASWHPKHWRGRPSRRRGTR